MYSKKKRRIGRIPIVFAWCFVVFVVGGILGGLIGLRFYQNRVLLSDALAAEARAYSLGSVDFQENLRFTDRGQMYELRFRPPRRSSLYTVRLGYPLLQHRDMPLFPDQVTLRNRIVATLDGASIEIFDARNGHVVVSRSYSDPSNQGVFSFIDFQILHIEVFSELRLRRRREYVIRVFLPPQNSEYEEELHPTLVIGRGVPITFF